jgi:ATP-dependent helicase/nuclease subunit A
LRPADDVPITSFENDEPLLSAAAAADLGTLVHRAMARIDFAAKSDVSACIRRLIDVQSSEADEHRQSAEEMLTQFLRSPRAKSLSQARHVHRELEFLLTWPPQVGSDTNGDADGKSTAGYLQGYIDCLYQDAEGNWHLLDYKTNRISAENVAAAAAQYEMQLGVYALAVEEILGKPPVELIVHFLEPSAEHRFVWDETMRRRTIEQVNQAISGMVTVK